MMISSLTKTLQCVKCEVWDRHVGIDEDGKCSGILRRVEWYDFTDISNDGIAVIFRIKQPRTS